MNDPTVPASAGDSRGGGKPSLSQRLVKLARDNFDFGLDLDGKAYGVRKDGGHIAMQLSGGRGSVRKSLMGLLMDDAGLVATQNALTETVSVLELLCERSGEPRRVHLRTARSGREEIYIDLGNRAEQAIRITPDGWCVLSGTDELPVLFRRSEITEALPDPVPGGDLNRLWEFVNLPAEADRQLITGWLIAATILPGRPVPILALLGEQGTAKTSSAKRLFSLFDPSTAPARRPPSDADRLLHAAAHSRSVIFDNLSSIPRWLSDGLCRVVTGESDVDRRLYTDDGARVIQLQGVLGFTSIDVGALAGDLAERCVWGDLEVIPPEKRRSESELDEEWELAYPEMFGGLLDLVVRVMEQLPNVHLTARPRMADFANVLAALDLATGWNSLAHYMGSQAAVAEDIVATDRFMIELAAKLKQPWHGTGRELYELLDRPADDKYWPEMRGVAGKLRRVGPDLRKAGWEVTENKPPQGSHVAKTWTLVPPGSKPNPAAIAFARLSRDLDLQDRADWYMRLNADGATPACIDDHVSVARIGSSLTCREPGCTASWSPRYDPWAERSRALGERLFEDLARVGLSLTEFDELCAESDFAGKRDA